MSLRIKKRNLHQAPRPAALLPVPKQAALLPVPKQAVPLPARRTVASPSLTGDKEEILKQNNTAFIIKERRE